MSRQNLVLYQADCGDSHHGLSGLETRLQGRAAACSPAIKQVCCRRRGPDQYYSRMNLPGSSGVGRGMSPACFGAAISGSIKLS
jgi:hypothetical protein